MVISNSRQISEGTRQWKFIFTSSADFKDYNKELLAIYCTAYFGYNTGVHSVSTGGWLFWLYLLGVIFNAGYLVLNARERNKK